MRYVLITAGLLALVVAFLMGTGIMRHSEALAPYPFLAGVVALSIGLATCDIVEAIKQDRGRPR